MSATVPYFFLSYSHSDWDNYLRRFYQDLRELVKRKTTESVELKIREDVKPNDDSSVQMAGGFRDAEGVQTGTAWFPAIVDAIGGAGVFICIYSPQYFSKDPSHDFCAKEFATFLLREGLAYDWYYHRGERLFGIVSSRNVFPVLWQGEPDLLDLNGVPPESVRSIKYDLQVASSEGYNNKYKAEGLWKIAVRRNPLYLDIVDRMAREIVLRGRTPPPPLDGRPDYATLFNPFWDPPPASARKPSDAPASGSAMPSATRPAVQASGPGQLVTLELRDTVSATKPWMPYPGAPSLVALVAESMWGRRLAMLHVALKIDSPDLLATAKALLTEATTDQARPILFIDPLVLANGTGRQAVLDIISLQWRGGIIIPASAKQPRAVALADAFHERLKLLPPERTRDLIIRDSVPTDDAFRTAVPSVADEILARIVAFGEVKQPLPSNVGPERRPRISNATR